METFTFTKDNYLIGGKPVYLNSGEIHYFRVPKSEWRNRMELLKAAGGNALATYVPWIVHEREEGKILFDQGDGVTDISDFLKLAHEVGLYVTVRLGPYVYSELRYNGLPGWITEKYPEILAQKLNGDNQSKTGSVSYLHPVFLEKVRTWYDALCPVVAKHTVKNGGAVAIVQVDNETAGIHVWFGGMDYNRETMGFGKDNGRYPLWLKSKYKSVDALNEAYGTKKSGFAEFLPWDELAGNLESMRRDKDYRDFYYSTIYEYMTTLIGYAKSHGIESPFCHNAGNLYLTNFFKETKEKLGGEFLLGCDHYYALCQGWGQNNPTPDYMARCFASLEMLRLLGNPPTVLEMQWGSICQWPPTTEEDLEASMMCHLACGMRGHNGYVFAGGPNPENCGTTGLIYDYNAPVSADGRCRPTYYALKRYGEFVKAHPELMTDKADSDIRILMPWRAFPGLGGRIDKRRSMSEDIFTEYLLRGVISTAFAAGLQPEFADPEKDDWTADFLTPVLIPCTGHMASANQQRVVDFVKAGGKVIFNPVIPFVDDDFNPCTIISDALGCTSGNEIVCGGDEATMRLDGKRLDFETGDLCEPMGQAAVFESGIMPPGAKVLGRELTSGKCIGWSNGSVAWLGVATWMGRFEHCKIFVKMLESVGGAPRWKSDNHWVMPFRRKTEKGTLVFLANLGSSKQSLTPSVRDNASSPWRKLEKITLAPMEVTELRIGN